MGEPAGGLRPHVHRLGYHGPLAPQKANLMDDSNEPDKDAVVGRLFLQVEQLQLENGRLHQRLDDCSEDRLERLRGSNGAPPVGIVFKDTSGDLWTWDTKEAEWRSDGERWDHLEDVEEYFGPLKCLGPVREVFERLWVEHQTQATAIQKIGSALGFGDYQKAHDVLSEHCVIMAALNNDS